MKKRIVVVAPGRGSYTKESLGYLNEHASSKWLQKLDALRREQEGDPALSEMDQEKTFKTSLHTKGEHASPLIYACSLGDFKNLDFENKYELIAVTGNSMGWYIALALAEAVSIENGYQVIQTMGGMMRDTGIIGGQVIYPVVDENWIRCPQKIAGVKEILDTINSKDGHEAYVSIFLGGYIVFGANKLGVQALLNELPKEGDFPFQLINHGAFHTPLLKEVSEKGFERLSKDLFQKPKYPLIDGRGKIWYPHSSSVKELYQYTLGHQVVQPYDFTASISVALKEFCPDHIVLLGPGNSLGGSIGQILIANTWEGISSKAEFSKRQKEDPFLISLGLR